jgi:hypothetical protein
VVRDLRGRGDGDREDGERGGERRPSTLHRAILAHINQSRIATHGPHVVRCGLIRHFPDGRGPSPSRSLVTALATSKARAFRHRDARPGLRAPCRGHSGRPGQRVTARRGAPRPPMPPAALAERQHGARSRWSQPRDPVEDAAEQLARHRDLRPLEDRVAAVGDTDRLALRAGTVSPDAEAHERVEAVCRCGILEPNPAPVRVHRDLDRRVA